MPPKRSRVLVRTALARAGGKCQSCGAEEEALEVDHILPLCLGGKDETGNMQALCAACHGTKTRDDVRRLRKAERIKRKRRTPLRPAHGALSWSRRAGEGEDLMNTSEKVLLGIVCAALIAFATLLISLALPSPTTWTKAAPRLPHSATCDEWIEWLVDGNGASAPSRVYRPFLEQIARDCLGREADPDRRALLPWVSEEPEEGA